MFKRGVMTVTDLGVINNDPCSTGYAVNSSGQIVGDAGACGIGGDAWLWENGGPMVDLNTLAIPGSGLHLADARLINDRGEIVCTGVLPNGDKHAVVLIPVGDEAQTTHGAAAIPALSPRYVPRPQRAANSRMPVVPDAKQSFQSSSTDYLESDRDLGPARGRPGYCETSGSVTNGYCVAYSYYNACSAVKRSASCPVGATPKRTPASSNAPRLDTSQSISGDRVPTEDLPSEPEWPRGVRFVARPRQPPRCKSGMVERGSAENCRGENP